MIKTIIKYYFEYLMTILTNSEKTQVLNNKMTVSNNILKLNKMDYLISTKARMNNNSKLTELEKLLIEFPKKKWDWNWVSENSVYLNILNI